jgi:hypothetical protein
MYAKIVFVRNNRDDNIVINGILYDEYADSE